MTLQCVFAIGIETWDAEPRGWHVTAMLWQQMSRLAFSLHQSYRLRAWIKLKKVKISKVWQPHLQLMSNHHWCLRKGHQIGSDFTEIMLAGCLEQPMMPSHVSVSPFRPVFQSIVARLVNAVALLQACCNSLYEQTASVWLRLTSVLHSSCLTAHRLICLHK